MKGEPREDWAEVRKNHEDFAHQNPNHPAVGETDYKDPEWSDRDMEELKEAGRQGREKERREKKEGSSPQQPSKPKPTPESERPYPKLSEESWKRVMDDLMEHLRVTNALKLFQSKNSSNSTIA